MRKFILIIFLLNSSFGVFAQNDSLDDISLRRMINLSEVVIRSNLDVGRFIQLVKKDTTFYKAFRNLRVLGYISMNDLRMFDKRGRVKALLQSKTRQHVSAGCRTMDVLEEKITGDIYDKKGGYNYYTSELYAGLFFTKGKICGENNIVKGIEFSTQSKKGMDKHKEQLKMLFFDPGKRIPGIPFMGDKGNVFDTDNAKFYDLNIDLADYDGQYCYVFTINAKAGLSSGDRNKIVIDKMITWFNSKTLEIVGRNYDLSYNAGLYDFNVQMEVLLSKFGNLLVPRIIRYKGSWNVAFKKREIGGFTATLSSFSSN